VVKDLGFVALFGFANHCYAGDVETITLCLDMRMDKIIDSHFVYLVVFMLYDFFLIIFQYKYKHI